VDGDRAGEHGAFNLFEIIAHQLSISDVDLRGMVSLQLFFHFEGEMENRELLAFDPFGACHDNNQNPRIFVIDNVHQGIRFLCLGALAIHQNVGLIFQDKLYSSQILNFIHHDRYLESLSGLGGERWDPDLGRPEYRFR
jgi:hypothetical protein